MLLAKWYWMRWVFYVEFCFVSKSSPLLIHLTHQKNIFLAQVLAVRGLMVEHHTEERVRAALRTGGARFDPATHFIDLAPITLHALDEAVNYASKHADDNGAKAAGGSSGRGSSIHGGSQAKVAAMIKVAQLVRHMRASMLSGDWESVVSAATKLEDEQIVRETMVTKEEVRNAKREGIAQMRISKFSETR